MPFVGNGGWLRVSASSAKRDTKQELVAATIRLASSSGLESASVRSITRAAGVTEGALYRHYRSKDELWRDVYARIVDAMAEDKAAILCLDAGARERVREWVRLTYKYYDGNRDAFNYVLMMPRDIAESFGDLYTKQGELFGRLYEQFRAAGGVRDMPVVLAAALFGGLLLSVPRQINDGLLTGPASSYTDEVADAAWRLLGRE